jgi:hypothetical protein
LERWLAISWEKQESKYMERWAASGYTVNKRIASFPSPAGMSLPNSPWAGIMTS